MGSLVKTRRSSRQALRQAMRQHLGDLVGFPLRSEKGGLRWMTIGPGPWRVQSLNEARLLAWRRSLTWLRRRFPRIIELELGEDWYPRQKRALRRLGRLLEAEGLAPLGLNASVRFLGLKRSAEQIERARVLERMLGGRSADRILALKLLVWWDDAPQAVDRLLAVFGDEALWRTPLSRGDELKRLRESLRRWRRLAPLQSPVIGPIEDRPRERFPFGEVAAYLSHLDGVSAEERRASLEWTAALLPVEGIRAWAEWWRGFEELEAECIRWARERRKRQPLRLRWRVLDQRIGAHGGRGPHRVDSGPFRLARGFAWDMARLGLAETGGLILERLRGWRREHLLSFFETWRRELADRARGERRLVQTWRAFAGALADCGGATGEGLEGKKFQEVADLFFTVAEDDRFGPQDAERMRAVVTHRLRHRRRSAYLFGNWPQHYLVEHRLARGRPISEVLAWAEAQDRDDSPDLSRPMVAVLADLAEDDLSRASALIDACPEDWDDDFVRALAPLIKDRRSARLLRALIIGRCAAELEELRRAVGAAKVGGVERRGLFFRARPRVGAQLAEGRDLSPALVRAAERALAWCDPGLVDGLLGPGRRALRRQLVALRRQLKTAEVEPERRRRMAIREAALLRRLRLGGRCPRREEERRVKKLEAARRRGMARTWIGDLHRSARSQPGEAVLISELGFLDRRHRRRARLLARARRRDSSWDGREHPKNAGFIARMRALGLNMGAWLAPPVSRARTPAGQALSLELEGDPLAILEMGAAFDTCLAPGRVNFFSALSNAWDINKRVLFARRPCGAILARSLIGLTADGGLLTYRLYAHAERASLERIFEAYLIDLCLVLGSVPVPRGRVERLVAEDWYDDGPELYCRLARELKPGSELMRALAGAGLVERRALLSGALSPLRLSPARERILAALTPQQSRLLDVLERGKERSLNAPAAGRRS